MSLPKQGIRRIVVDGIAYRWSVRPKPTYSQALTQKPLTFAVEREESGQSILVIGTDTSRPDNWVGAVGASITPAVVERAIRLALKRGWQPLKDGGPFQMSDFSLTNR